MKTFAVTEPFLDLNCGLAESPFWEQDENILRFVDIANKLVYRVNLDKGPTSLQQAQYESSVSITAALASAEDSFVFGGKYGIGISKKDGSEVRLLQRYWDENERQDGKEERMRANDGGVDSKGRFWVSALCDPAVTPFAPDGVLFRFDPDGSLHRIITGVTIPNGMTWSKDNKLLYFTDTQESSIFVYDFDAETGDVSNKRLFYLVEGEGGPDGHAQDAEGNLWVAIWGAWKVVKITPQGEVTAEIRLPTRCVTAVAFAGEDVYITSEAEQEPEKYPESVRYQGAVFKCHVGVGGRAPYNAIIHE